MSRSGRYEEIVRLAQDLSARAPERIIWGTDWPHSSIFKHGQVPNDGDLMSMMLDFAPDETVRRNILVDPARLFGFARDLAPASAGENAVEESQTLMGLLGAHVVGAAFQGLLPFWVQPPVSPSGPNRGSAFLPGVSRSKCNGFIRLAALLMLDNCSFC
jgi:Amidohydrolase